MIKVFLAEDHKLLREGIKYMFKDDPEILITGEACTGIEAIENIHKAEVDVLLIDIKLPGKNGFEVTNLVKTNFKHINILALSMMDDEDYVIKMIEAGALGYLLKNSGKEELLTAIKKVASGNFYLSHEISKSILKKFSELKNEMENPKLDIDFSEREMEILYHISEGKTNNEIADLVCISRRTVESYRKNLIEKTNTNNTASLIKFVFTNGILK
jgi:DNA-binding NarL/FixJ family response regulator